MNLIGYQTWATLHRARRARFSLPTGENGDAPVGYALAFVGCALLALWLAGLL